MTRTSHVLLRIVPLVWLGMVASISLIETPLKFNAPGVTLEIGLGIGRLVFHALNLVELALAVLLMLSIVWSRLDVPRFPGRIVTVAASCAAVLIVLQVALVRPTLDDRLDARLRGEAVGASSAHIAYIAMEGAKLLALATVGIGVALVPQPQPQTDQ